MFCCCEYRLTPKMWECANCIINVPPKTRKFRATDNASVVVYFHFPFFVTSKTKRLDWYAAWFISVIWFEYIKTSIHTNAIHKRQQQNVRKNDVQCLHPDSIVRDDGEQGWRTPMASLASWRCWWCYARNKRWSWRHHFSLFHWCRWWSFLHRFDIDKLIFTVGGLFDCCSTKHNTV